MLKRIDHVAITVADLDASIDFYCRALGFELVARWASRAPGMNGIAFLELGGTRIELIAPEVVPSRNNIEELGGLRHLCLSTGDLDRESARLASLGIRFIKEPHTLDGGGFDEMVASEAYPIKKGLRRAVIEGPDEVRIEIIEVKE
jgi:glyoxylase I family protein